MTTESKEIHNKFYSFEIPFSSSIPENIIELITGFKISETNDEDSTAYGLSYIQIIEEGTGKPIFYIQFIKGEFGKVDYLVGKSLFQQVISNTTEEQDTLGNLSNRTADDVKINPYYSVMRISAVTTNGTSLLRGIISHPTLKGSLTKMEIETVLKKLLSSKFNVNENELLTFGLSETYSQKSLLEIDDMFPNKIIFTQKKNVSAFASFFGFGTRENRLENQIDGNLEEEITYKVEISKRNTGVFKKNFTLVAQADAPIKKVILESKNGKQVNDEFFYKQSILSELTNGYLLGENKAGFIKKTKDEIVNVFNKIYP